MDKWIVANHVLNSNYLSNAELSNYKGLIIITYETRTGIRHTKAVHSNYGKLSSGEVKEQIIAFMFMPEPYEGKAQ